MDFNEIYNFLFTTYAGVGILVAISLVLCILIAIVLEMRTRKTYVDRGEPEEDEWSLFDDEDDDASDDDA